MYRLEIHMAESMVRKQIYLYRRQNMLLKRLAKQRGVSEAEVVRQALEHETERIVPTSRKSEKAWDEIITFARTLRDRNELMEGEPYRWDREELYREREDRWIEPRKEK
jgi:hypothetical protein